MKKLTFAKFIILIVLVATLLATLTACSIFEGLFQTSKDTPEVTDVSITATGLTKVSTGVYTAKVGEEFTLKIKLNEDAPQKPTYKWYLKKDSQKKAVIDGATSSTLKYTFDEYTDSTFVFSASVDGVESKNTITVTLEYADKLSDVSITSSTHDIIDGAVQQDLKDVAPITFNANWNKSALPEDTEIDIEWTVDDDDTVLSTEEEFVFTPSGEGTFEVNLAVTDGTDTLSATVKVVVIERFSAVSTATISVESGADPFGEGAETQYLQIVDSEDRDAVTLSLSVTPVGETDLTSPVTWTVRDKDGERNLSGKGRTVTFTPAYGETMVTVTVDNVVSKHVVIFAFTESDYTASEKYVEATFVWDGGVENAYLTDQTDLNRFMQYAVSTRKVTAFAGGSAVNPENGFPFETAPTFDFIANNEDHPKALNTALNSMDEAGNFSIRTGYSQSGDKLFNYVLYLDEKSAFMNPTEHYSPAEDVTQDETGLVHYKELSSSEKRSALPIDDNPEYPTAITDSQMLYRVVGWGYKPTFDSTPESQKMKALYDEIRKVAINYVTDDMTDYMKTLIFYEWIAVHTDYDYAIVAVEDDSPERVDKLDYNAFSLEGVFADADGEGYGQAVCDGRAKAFVILCGLEDITAIRITGDAQVGGESEGHAWNKVLIDANGDGVKEWYLCDTTWSDRSSADDRVERLNKQYFLVTDAYVSATHIPDDEAYNPPCTTTFDYYAKTVIENGNKDFDLFINGYEELKNAVVYARDNGILLEIKVASPYVTSANELLYKIQSIFAITGGGSVEGIIPLTTASTYGIYSIIFG
ncbi:MAG: hypothetical protein IJY49_00900 [Clostridia bacterium]|nr:hypothetical protein [Clostridia bacterium]